MMATENSAPKFAVLQPESFALSTGTAALPSPAAGDRAINDAVQGPFGNDGLTFADVLDVINPLQHLPIISTIYRNLTGDTIDPAPRIAGSALFGGPIGAFFGIINVVSKTETGRDVGEHVLAWIEDGIGTPENQALADTSGTPGSGHDGAAYAAYAAAPSSIVSTSNSRTLRDAYADFAGDNDEAALVLEDTLANVIESVAVPSGGGISSPQGPLLMSEQYVAMKPPAPGRLFGRGDSAAAVANGATAPTETRETPSPVHLSGHIPFAQVDHPGDTLIQVEKSADKTPISPGALAADGGWFTDAMMSALAKYQQAAALSGASVQSDDGRVSETPASLGVVPEVASPPRRNDIGFISG